MVLIVVGVVGVHATRIIIIYGLGDWHMLLLLPRLWPVGVGLRVPLCGLCAVSDPDEAIGTCELCALL